MGVGPAARVAGPLRRGRRRAIQIPGAFGSLRFRIGREDEWTFHVEPGRINYAGRILVGQRRSGCCPTPAS